jgi:hypothetical protein
MLARQLLDRRQAPLDRILARRIELKGRAVFASASAASLMRIAASSSIGGSSASCGSRAATGRSTLPARATSWWALGGSDS